MLDSSRVFPGQGVDARAERGPETLYLARGARVPGPRWGSGRRRPGARDAAPGERRMLPRASLGLATAMSVRLLRVAVLASSLAGTAACSSSPDSQATPTITLAT